MGLHGRGFIKAGRPNKPEGRFPFDRRNYLHNPFIRAGLNGIDPFREAKLDHLGDIVIRKSVEILCVSSFAKMRMSIKGIRAANDF